MANKKGSLYLYEAIELRNEYDRHIGLLQGLLGEYSKRRSLFKDDRKIKNRQPTSTSEKLMEC